MVKKKLKWMILPILLSVTFIGLSSFQTDTIGDDPSGSFGTCKKSDVSTDYCTAEGGSKAGCSNSTSTDNC